MRNGDFVPSRLEAQRDAANLIVGTKIRENPENTVGMLTMANKFVMIDILLPEIDFNDRNKLRRLYISINSDNNDLC